MWSRFMTIKMKNIGEEKTVRQLKRIIKKGNRFAFLAKPVKKDDLTFVSDDGPINMAAIKEFSRKHKDQIVGVSVDLVHNAYSRCPEREDLIEWNYYKNGDLILCYMTDNKKEFFYTCDRPDYDKLVLKTTVGDVLSVFEEDEEALNFFRIKNLKKINNKVSIDYNRFMARFNEYYLFDVFDNIEYDNLKIVTYKRFIDSFPKNELALFKKDIKKCANKMKK